MEKARFDNQVGWCIEDSNGRTSPCTFEEAFLVNLGWNFTDISGVLVREDLNRVIDLSKKKIRGHFQVFDLDKYREGFLVEVQD